MNKKVTIFAIIFIVCNLYSATIKGRVFSSENNPLLEANITILGTTLGSASDMEGFYYITKIPKGSYTLFCQYIGYYPRKVININLNEDDIFDLDFLLFSKTYQLKNITIETDKDKINKNKFKLRFFKSDIIMGRIILEDYIYKKPTAKVIISFWDKVRWWIWKKFQ